MYVEDPGLESLLALANEELLVCNNQDVTITENLDHHTGKMTNPKNEQRNEVKLTPQMCMYPNCKKSFFKPSLLKASNIIFHGKLLIDVIETYLNNKMLKLFLKNFYTRCHNLPKL